MYELHIWTLTIVLKHKTTDVNIADQYGSSALSVAALHNCTTNVRQILKHQHTNVNNLSTIKRTPLILGCLYGYDEKRVSTARQLLNDSRININMSDRCGKTALTYCEKANRVFVMAMILHGRI
jgi:ankyrin repeat protein